MKTFYRALLWQGKSIQWLAEKLEVSHQTIYGWKLGKTKPNPKYLVKMSKLLNINIDELVKEFY